MKCINYNKYTNKRLSLLDIYLEHECTVLAAWSCSVLTMGQPSFPHSQGLESQVVGYHHKLAGLRLLVVNDVPAIQQWIKFI